MMSKRQRNGTSIGNLIQEQLDSLRRRQAITLKHRKRPVTQILVKADIVIYGGHSLTSNVQNTDEF